MLQRYCFHFFSAVASRFEHRQNACFRGIVFIFSLQFQVVSNTVRMHVLEILFSKSFQILFSLNMFHYQYKHEHIYIQTRMRYIDNLRIMGLATSS